MMKVLFGLIAAVILIVDGIAVWTILIYPQYLVENILVGIAMLAGTVVIGMVCWDVWTEQVRVD